MKIFFTIKDLLMKVPVLMSNLLQRKEGAMPQGKGTYGTTKGRPPKKSSSPKKKKAPSRKKK
jgi:hypothetical protein